MIATSRLVELLDSDETCPSARDNLGVDDEGRRLCLLPSEEWTVESGVEACPDGQLRMEDGGFFGAEVRFECAREF